MGRRRMARMADEDVLALVREGDPDAFGALYDRHSRVAYSLAYRVVGEKAAAEDVLQEAFLAIWRNVERYEPARGSVRSWVLGVVRNRAIDGLRRADVHGRRRASSEGLEERRAAPELTDVEVVRRDEASRLRGALGALPQDQLRVLELGYFGGFTQVEIADMLDTPLGTVKSRMRRGLERLEGDLRLEEAG